MNESKSPLIKSVEIVLAGLDYQDPDFKGSIVAMRKRGKTAIDDNDQYWYLSDSLLVLPSGDNKRTVSLTRGVEFDQIILSLDLDEDKVGVGGLGSALFTGDPREEFLAGIRLIEAASGDKSE